MKNIFGKLSTIGLLASLAGCATGTGADVDSDGDGLLDGKELALHTDPYDADSDDDGVWDGREDENGTNPLATDSDGDGMWDGDEDEDGDGIHERHDYGGLEGQFGHGGEGGACDRGAAFGDAEGDHEAGFPEGAPGQHPGDGEAPVGGPDDGVGYH